MSKKEKRKAEYGILNNNFYFFKLLFKICPSRVILTIIDYIVGYSVWIFSSMIITKVVFTALDAKTPFIELVPFLVFAAVLYIARNFFSNWFSNRFVPITNEKISAKFMKLLYDKTNSVELACFENPDFFNKYTLALAEANQRFNHVLECFIEIIVAGIAAAYVYVELVRIDPFIILFALSPLIGTFIFAKLAGKIGFNRNREINPYHRRKEYVTRVMYLNSYAKEVRLSNAFNILNAKYEEGYKGAIKTHLKYAPKATPVSWGVQMFNLMITYQGLLFYAAYRAIVKGDITIVDFGIIAGAMSAAIHTLMDFAQSIISSVENGYYIDNIRTFLDYMPNIPENADGVIPEKNIQSIEFKNATFTYPNTDKPVFTDLNLKINAGEKIVVVGLNGAGKSTFVKLLMRFYDPSTGEILVNGINIKDYKLKEYRRLFRAAFQDFQLYSMSVLSNVMMKSSQTESDKEKAFAALMASGIIERIDKLPQRADTTVTKEFDPEGVVFSGGEGQKLSISRAMFEGSSICVFDEPTSALDAAAESRLYNETLKSTEDKIVFFISHRLSASAYADKVMLIDGHEVKEFGTHDELLAQNGLYSEMFSMQAERYREQINWAKEDA